MRILVACEESQAVTIALRVSGHEAYRLLFIKFTILFPNMLYCMQFIMWREPL